MSFKGHHGLCQELILDKHLDEHLAHHAYGKLSVQKLPSGYSCFILHISDLYCYRSRQMITV